MSGFHLDLQNKQQINRGPRNTTNVLFHCGRERNFLKLKSPGFNDPSILYQMEEEFNFYI